MSDESPKPMKPISPLDALHKALQEAIVSGDDPVLAGAECQAMAGALQAAVRGGAPEEQYVRALAQTFGQQVPKYADDTLDMDYFGPEGTEDLDGQPAELPALGQVGSDLSRRPDTDLS